MRYWLAKFCLINSAKVFLKTMFSTNSKKSMKVKEVRTTSYNLIDMFVALNMLHPNSKIILWHDITFEKYVIFRTKMKISIQDEKFENRSGP